MAKVDVRTEKMEESLWYAFASVSMLSPRILREHIHRLYRTLFAAKEGAEYRCDKFLEAVRPAKKVRTSSKKSSAKKGVEDSANSKQK